MKKFPNSPPNRLPNSPHPLKKVKKSTSQQVNESTSFGGVKSLLWVCLGLLWVRRVRKAEHLFNPLNPIFTYFQVLIGFQWIKQVKIISQTQADPSDPSDKSDSTSSKPSL